MGSMAELRQMVEARKKDGLATTKFPVCMDLESARQRDVLVRERAERVRRTQGSLAGPDTDDLDAGIEELEESMAAATLEFTFQALPGEKYQELINEHPNLARDPRVNMKFARALMDKCFEYVTDHDGDRHEGVEVLDELLGVMRHGDMDAMSDAVVQLNRGRVDAPFSVKSSGRSAFVKES